MSDATSIATSVLVYAFTGSAPTISSIISSSYDVERVHRSVWNSSVVHHSDWEGFGTIVDVEEGTRLAESEGLVLQRCWRELHTVGFKDSSLVVTDKIQVLTTASRCSQIIADHHQTEIWQRPIFWRLRSWVIVSNVR